MLTRHLLEVVASELLTLADGIEDHLIAALVPYLAEQYRVVAVVRQDKGRPSWRPGQALLESKGDESRPNCGGLFRLALDLLLLLGD
jgi:hypothetical protein